MAQDSTFSTPDTPTVKDLLATIGSGRLAVPNFQRSFVWDPADTQKLLVSMIAKYPAGTLLFWEQGDIPLRSRPFEGLEFVKLRKKPELVLDGQQRLTSVVQAFTGSGQYRFYLDLDKLETLYCSANRFDPSGLEEAVVFRDTAARQKAKRPPANAAEEAAQYLFPLRALGDDEIDEWRDEAEAHRNPQGESAARALLRNVIKTYVRPLLSEYRFPTVTLPDTTPLDAVCRIFETINRTGIQLTVFELLTARFWPEDVDLRGMWEQAKQDYPILDAFSIDPYNLLQAVSLRATRARVPAGERGTASAQRSDVLKLTPAEFATYWDSVAQGAAQALHMLSSECGVLTAKWLPYSMMVVPLAAIWSTIAGMKGPAAGRAREKLKRYFWCTVFMRNYDQGGNSQAGRDFVDLESWLQDGPKPEAVRDFALAPETLESAHVNLQALYKGCMALILSGPAVDFHTAASITPAKLLKEEIDAHHIFPKAFLEGVPGADAELILNRTLIDKATNIALGRTAPAKYFKEVSAKLGAEKTARLFRSHFVDPTPNGGIRKDDYDRFIERRRDLLLAKIREVCS